MRGFLGMTAHAIVIDDDHKPKLSSFLIGWDRFSGSHTGERICTAFNEITEKFNVINKIDYIITDNASNMRKAFNASFPVIEPVDNCIEIFVDDHASAVDENELWEDLPEIELDEINAMLDANCKRLRLSCYTHTQHIVVNDGLKNTKCVSSAVAKATSLSTLHHQSSSFRDLFNTTFGNNKGIPAAVSTRWNSTVWMLKAVTVLDIKQFNEILDTHDRKDFVFTHKEEAQLRELVDILQPFMEATDLQQTEKTVTISSVVPTVLSLNSHLENMKLVSKYCLPVVKALQKSLSNRFASIFQRSKMSPNPASPELNSFRSDFYLISAVLYPHFRLYWLADVHASSEEKERLSSEVKGTYINL